MFALGAVEILVGIPEMILVCMVILALQGVLDGGFGESGVVVN